MTPNTRNKSPEINQGIPAMRGKSYKGVVFFFAALLLLLSAIQNCARACPPQCPPCYYWNGQHCIYGCNPDRCETCKQGECQSTCDSENCQRCNGSGSCESTCDPNQCEQCDGEGNCESSCDPNQCEVCDGQGNCESTCDPDQCEECDGQGNCEVCGGDPDKVCCEGSCEPICEQTGYDAICSSDNDKSCRACVGIGGNCSNYDARVYSNQTIYNCTGGCPGECDEEYPSPPCYDEYYCNNWIHYTFAECSAMGPTGPRPLECYDAGMPWGCTRCQQGDYRRTLYNLSMICY